MFKLDPIDLPSFTHIRQGWRVRFTKCTVQLIEGNVVRICSKPAQILHNTKTVILTSVKNQLILNIFPHRTPPGSQGLKEILNILDQL
jgi:hypothetical protein